MLVTTCPEGQAVKLIFFAPWKYTLYYACAKLKAVKGKRLRGNTGIVHLSIVRWNLLKRNINFLLVTSRKENRQIGV